MTMRPGALALVSMVLVGLGVGMVGAGGTGVDDSGTPLQESPTVSVTNTSAVVGEEMIVAVRLSSAPNGVAGYNLTLTVDGTASVVFDAVTISDAFDLSEVVTRTDTRVTFRGADLNGSIAPGERNVSLARVELTGQSSGTATVSITVNQFDDSDGNRVDPQTRAGTLRVNATSSNEP